jgi:WD40 repeat protein
MHVRRAFCLLLSLALPCLAQDQLPVLRINAEMHNARIEDIATDEAGSLALTASHDKTARLWSLPDGALLGVLRPPLGKGNEGKLNAAALSPDGRVAAVAGVTGYEWDKTVSVYLFDVASGRMLRRFSQLPNLVFALCFSASGQYLAAGLAGGEGVHVWDVVSGTTIGAAGGYGDNCHGLDWRGDDLLLTTCLDGQLRSYRRIANKFLADPPKRFANAQPFGLSISPDGQCVAVGFLDNPQVEVLSLPSLAPRFFPDLSGISNGNLKAVHWSRDGMRLYAAGHWDEAGANPVRVWNLQGQRAAVDISIPSNFIHAITAQSGSAAALAGGGPVWGIVQDGRILQRAEPPIAQWEHTFAAFRCSADGNKVTFAWTEDAHAIGQFDLAARVLTAIAPASALAKLEAPSLHAVPLEAWCSVANATERHRALAQGLKNTDLGAVDGSTQPTLRGKEITLVEHDTARCASAGPQSDRFSLGSDFQLTRYTLMGKAAWSIKPPGITWVVNESANGHFIIAGHNDGTIRWYRESDGKELLALFPHADRKRWVLWTPQGYYDCSPGAENLLGWHVNRGRDQAADFFPVARFRAIYYRPDVVQRVLANLDVTKALNQANAALGRPPSGIDDIAKVIARLSPPVVELDSGGSRRQIQVPADATSLTLRYRVRNTGLTPATRVELRLNGRPLAVAAPMPAGDAIAKVEVPWSAGTSGTLAIVASHDLASSEAAVLQIQRNGVAPPSQLPDLYVVAAGVSKLKANIGLDTNGDGTIDDMEFLGRFSKDGVCFSDLRSAATDAQRMSTLFDTEKGRCFANINTQLLLNQQATTSAIRSVLVQVAQQARNDDVVIVSFAGHGYADAAHAFLLATYDLDPDHLHQTALTGQELAHLLAPVKARVVLLLDTCQSAAVLGRSEDTSVITGPSDLTGLVNTLSSSEQGIIVLSSSGESEMSFEAEGGGCFTRALIEGMAGKAADHGAVTCTTLQRYLAQRVPELARQTLGPQAIQTPDIIMPKSTPDFVLARPR